MGVSSLRAIHLLFLDDAACGDRLLGNGGGRLSRCSGGVERYWRVKVEDEGLLRVSAAARMDRLERLRLDDLGASVEELVRIEVVAFHRVVPDHVGEQSIVSGRQSAASAAS